MTRREKAAVRVVVLETLLEALDAEPEVARGGARPGEDPRESAIQITARRMLADARRQAT